MAGIADGALVIQIPQPILSASSYCWNVLGVSQVYNVISTEFPGGASIFLVFVGTTYFLLKNLLFGERGAPKVAILPEDEAESLDVLEGRRKLDPQKASPIDPTKPGQIQCWDPCTMDDLGTVKALTPDDVKAAIERARVAQKEWKNSTFEQRRFLLRIILRCITDNIQTIVRVACRDSGKTKIDAYMGEILVTCEKIRWLCSQGEKWLLPEYRDTGLMNLHKTSRVEYTPVGVVGAIVPWNYPFHNVFNPLLAATFAGNAIVIKTSEYASWSTNYLGRMITACLRAAGAPPNLVQLVTGFGDAGAALIDHGVDKLIFVGSVAVGKKVYEACSKKLIPIVLELGGKDPFIICDDADPAAIAQLACRGAFQNMGQNCAGPERFLVYDRVYDDFCQRVAAIVSAMAQGPTLSSPFIDCGAVRLPQQRLQLQRLVDDAVARGARVLAGGRLPPDGSPLAAGQFYPPTVLVDVTEDSLIWKEEIFGPILCVARVKGDSDAEAVRMANHCDFGLSACAFSRSGARAAAICRGLECGMASVNDLEGTTYLSQSLPFGGVKHSGFDRFAGPEGLRGLCNVKSIVADRVVLRGGPFLALPDQLAYPSSGQGAGFCEGLIRMLYGHGVGGRLAGLAELIKWSVVKPPRTEAPPARGSAARR